MQDVVEILKQKARELQKELDRIVKAIRMLSDPTDLRVATIAKPKRHMSPAARRKIAKAQRTRWAAVRQQKGAAA